MASIIDRLPAYAVPFVTRSLRRGRGRRYVALSFGLALLLVLTTLWIGLGRGESARDARVDLGMEPHVSTIEYREFVLVRMDPGPPLGSKQVAIDNAEAMVRAAIVQVPDEPWQLELQERARMLANGWAKEPASNHYFSWNNPTEVYRLGKIVERGGVPAIVAYTPVVGLHGTLDLLAMLTGGLLILLLTVVAPLLVALQQASERHENTLQPLTGTALDARRLMIGLACGPLSIVAIFAAPIAVLFTGATVAVGEFGSLLFLPAVVGTAIGLVFGAQLLAHLIGARLAPGLIAVGLLCLLGFVALAGLGGSAGLHHGLLGLPAALPHSGLFALLGEGFGDCWKEAALAAHRGHGPMRAGADLELSQFAGPMVVGTLGAALLGLLALLALTHHVEGRDTLLGPGHALFGALVCITMVDVTIPTEDTKAAIHQGVGLPALALSFLLLTMARVPNVDLPTKLRRIPFARLIGEFAGWTLIHMIVGAALDWTAWGFHPLTVLGVGWCVLVIVLLAIRVAATPGRILGHVWTVVCLIMLPMIYGLTTFWALEPEANLTFRDAEFVVFVYMFMAVLVPFTLIRHLRKHGIQLSSSR